MTIRSQPVNNNYRKGFEEIFGKKDNIIEQGGDNLNKGELLREDLRELPADLVTKDIAEDHKVHELDDPHIAENYIEEYKKAQDPTVDNEERTKQLIAEFQKELDPSLELNQAKVDVVRFRIIRSLLKNLQTYEEMEKKRYVWFPQNNTEIYELRKGNPPSRSLRKKHLRDLELHIDLFDWPPRIVDILKANGILGELEKDLVEIKKSVDGENQIIL